MRRPGISPGLYLFAMQRRHGRDRNRTARPLLRSVKERVALGLVVLLIAALVQLVRWLLGLA